MKKKIRAKSFKKFNNRIKKIRENINNFIQNNRYKDKKIIGYGASTKGNIVLNYCQYL